MKMGPMSSETKQKMTTKSATRLSVIEDGAGVCSRFGVRLDGEEQRFCTVADADQGYVVRFRTLRGAPIRSREGHLESETLFGKVEIYWKSN